MVERMVPLDQLIRHDEDIISAQGPPGKRKKRKKRKKIEKCKARSENRRKWCDACKNVQISQ